MKERYRFMGRGGVQNHEYLTWVRFREFFPGGIVAADLVRYDAKWFYDQMIGRKVTE